MEYVWLVTAEIIQTLWWRFASIQHLLTLLYVCVCVCFWPFASPPSRFTVICVRHPECTNTHTHRHTFITAPDSGIGNLSLVLISLKLQFTWIFVGVLRADCSLVAGATPSLSSLCPHAEGKCFQPTTHPQSHFSNWHFFFHFCKCIIFLDESWWQRSLGKIAAFTGNFQKISFFLLAARLKTKRNSQEI